MLDLAFVFVLELALEFKFRFALAEQATDNVAEQSFLLAFGLVQSCSNSDSNSCS